MGDALDTDPIHDPHIIIEMGFYAHRVWLADGLGPAVTTAAHAAKTDSWFTRNNGRGDGYHQYEIYQLDGEGQATDLVCVVAYESGTFLGQGDVGRLCVFRDDDRKGIISVLEEAPNE